MKIQQNLRWLRGGPHWGWMLRLAGIPTDILRVLTFMAMVFGWVATEFRSHGDDGRVVLRSEEAGWRLSVDGDSDDEWRLQSSDDLLTWTAVNAGVPILSGRTNAPSVLLGPAGEPARFYRAQKTLGLFDPSLVRTVSLTFTQSTWQTQLAANYGRNTNLTATLELNGRTYAGVGVRYKGNSSYSMGGTKKSLNIEVDYLDPTADAMRYETLNLNNAAGDQTILREALYFNVMRRYTVCPGATFAKLYINGAYWGLYSCVQQQDGDLIDEWFPSNDGDRWRAPNAGGGTGVIPGTGGGGTRPPIGGGPGGGGGGGGFASGASALMDLGDTVSSYTGNYELKTDNSTNAWERLLHAIQVLHDTPEAEFRDKVEDVLAVDRWLWFLAVENVFADDDSYFNKGADYMFYYEPESGRIHPVEHDGNEAFVAADVQMTPLQGTNNVNRPVLMRFLAVPELRQRYLAHMRTLLEESFHPDVMNSLIDTYRDLTAADVAADTKKSFNMAQYTNAITTLKSFVRQRYTYLTNHAELRPLPPVIESVQPPAAPVVVGAVPFVTARVTAQGTNGIESVWLYHRGHAYGRFQSEQMLDDGAHGDGEAGDGVFGAATTNYPAGTKVRFYVEARSANPAQAAAFSPAHAEQETLDYRVQTVTATASPVVINELMASNSRTLADPQGEYDDWIELRNVTDAEVDLSGHYLTDEPNNPRKWAFPDGTRIAAGGFLIVWADEDGTATSGLHASFKLSASGEQVILTDTDGRVNAILDSVTFGSQETDRSYGRSSADPNQFEVQTPSPGAANP